MFGSLSKSPVVMVSLNAISRFLPSRSAGMMLSSMSHGAHADRDMNMPSTMAVVACAADGSCILPLLMSTPKSLPMTCDMPCSQIARKCDMAGQELRTPDELTSSLKSTIVFCVVALPFPPNPTTKRSP